MDLPNANWLRSPKKPEYAVCLDLEDECFGWIMLETQTGWESVRKLTLDEVEQAMLEKPDFSGHIPQLRTLHSITAGIGG